MLGALLAGGEDVLVDMLLLCIEPVTGLVDRVVCIVDIELAGLFVGIGETVVG